MHPGMQWRECEVFIFFCTLGCKLAVDDSSLTGSSSDWKVVSQPTPVASRRRNASGEKRSLISSMISANRDEAG